MVSSEPPAPLAEPPATAMKRPSPSLTLITSLPPPVPSTSSRKPLSATKRTTSSYSSSLVTSPTASSSSALRTVSPSSAMRVTNRRSSPAYSALASSSSSSSDGGSSRRSPCASTLTSTHRPLAAPPPAPCLKSPPISPALYFRLLKKSHVLDQLFHMSTHFASQQQQLRELQADRVRTDSVQGFVFQELETYKRKFVEAQKSLLELVEAMTALSVQEEELQRGTGTAEAQQLAQQTKEERVMRDLEAAANDLHSADEQRQGSARGGRSVESSALRAVGLQRVGQFQDVCVQYEAQLKKSEAELSRAMHSAYKDECLAKLERYETMQRRHDDELKALTTRIENLTNQTTELQDVIDGQRDELAQLKELTSVQQERHTRQCSAIEQFGTELKTELRKRYGVVPSVVDARWHAFFPHCSAPQ